MKRILFVVDRGQRIVEWSDEAAKLWGIPAEEALGRACYSIVEGYDYLKRRTCEPGCSAFQSLSKGCLEASCPLLSRVLSSRQLRVKLIALPSPGGAIVRLTSSFPSSDTVRELCGLSMLSTSFPSQDVLGNLQGALKVLREVTGVEAAEIFLTEPGGREMVLVAFHGIFPSSFFQITCFKAGEGFPGLILAHKEPIITTDLICDARYLRTRVKEKGFRTYLCVPLLGPKGILGSLNIASRRPDMDLERALRILTWARVPITTTLQAGLLQLSEAVRGEIANQDALHRILRNILTTGDGEAGAVLLFDRRGGVGHSVLEGLLEPFCLGSLIDPQNCLAMKGEGVVLYGSLRPLPCCRGVLGDSRMLYCLPLMDNGRAFGVIQIAGRKHPSLPPTSHLWLLLEIVKEATPVVRLLRDNLEAQHRAELLYRQLLQQASRIELPSEAAETPNLDIRCFSRFEVYRQGSLVPPGAFPRRKALTLLKILLTFKGHPLSKETLIELLWPETDPERGENLLYVVVSALRQTIDFKTIGGDWTFIKREGDSYRFDIEGPCRLDIKEFEEWIRLGKKAEGREEVEAAINAYERAIELYRGDFLEDEPFAEWCMSRRESLRESYFDVVRRLTSLCARINDWERSIKYLHRALEIDPLQEELQRGLMRSLWAIGQRDEALRQYQRYCDLLQRELGLSPLPETSHLAELIRTSPAP